MINLAFLLKQIFFSLFFIFTFGAICSGANAVTERKKYSFFYLSDLKNVKNEKGNFKATIKLVANRRRK